MAVDLFRLFRLVVTALAILVLGSFVAIVIFLAWIMGVL